MFVSITMLDRLRLLGRCQGTFVSIAMIDRRGLLGGYQSMFIIVIDTKMSCNTPPISNIGLSL